MKKTPIILFLFFCCQFMFGQTEEGGGNKNAKSEIESIKEELKTLEYKNDIVAKHVTSLVDTLDIFLESDGNLQFGLGSIKLAAELRVSIPRGKTGYEDLKLLIDALSLSLASLIQEKIDDKNSKDKQISEQRLEKLKQFYQNAETTGGLGSEEFEKNFSDAGLETQLAFIKNISEKNQGKESTFLFTGLLIALSAVIIISIWMRNEYKLKTKYKTEVKFLNETIIKYKQLIESTLEEEYARKTDRAKADYVYKEMRAFDSEVKETMAKLEELIDSYNESKSGNELKNTQVGNMEHRIENLKEELEGKRSIISSLQAKLKASNEKLLLLGRRDVGGQTEDKTIEKIQRGNIGSEYIFGEVMLTAGPRKRFSNEENSDIDLGEDVSGFASYGDKTLFWLLDGTSDSSILKNPMNKREFFSSRLLAQSIAFELQQNYGNNENLRELVETAIQETRKNWMSALRELPDAMRNKLIRTVRMKAAPFCSITLLAGTFDIAGDFKGFRVGDSKLFLFSKDKERLKYVKSPLSEKPKAESDRLFFRLDVSDEGELNIRYNQVRFLEREYKDISTVIGVSDGVGSVVEAQLKHNYPKVSEMIRRQLPTYPNNTFDDKSFFILQVRKNNK